MGDGSILPLPLEDRDAMGAFLDEAVRVGLLDLSDDDKLELLAHKKGELIAGMSQGALRALAGADPLDVLATALVAAKLGTKAKIKLKVTLRPAFIDAVLADVKSLCVVAGEVLERFAS